jgi:hypothetical protein
LGNWAKTLLSIVVLCAVTFFVGPRAYEWPLYEVTMEEWYPEGTPRKRLQVSRWTGESTYRGWFRSGALRFEAISDSDGDRCTEREWYEVAPGVQDTPRLRREEMTDRHSRIHRRVVWNYDGSVNPESSITRYEGERAASTAREQVRLDTLDSTTGLGSRSWLEGPLRSPDPVERERAVRTLGYLQRDDFAIRAASLLTDPDPFVALAAAESLGEMGPAADEAVDLIVNYVLSRPSGPEAPWEMCDIATNALAKIGTTRALRGLIAIIDSWSCDCQSNAIRLVSSFERGDIALDALLRACRVPFLASDAIIAIGEIGSEAERAVPELISMLEQLQRGDPRRLAVVESLGRIGPSARSAVPMLTLLAKETSGLDDSVQESLVALARVSPENPMVFDFIVDRIRADGIGMFDEPRLTRSTLEECLAAGGPANIDRLAPLLQEHGLDRFAARVLWLMNDRRASSLVSSAVSGGATWLSRDRVFLWSVPILSESLRADKVEAERTTPPRSAAPESSPAPAVPPGRPRKPDADG